MTELQCGQDRTGPAQQPPKPPTTTANTQALALQQLLLEPLGVAELLLLLLLELLAGAEAVTAQSMY